MCFEVLQGMESKVYRMWAEGLRALPDVSRYSPSIYQGRKTSAEENVHSTIQGNLE